MESWTAVAGYEGIYEVSDLGNVKRTVHLPHAKAFGAVLKPVRNNKGYYSVTLCHPVMGKRHHLVHRLVAAAFVPNAARKPCVNHLDGTRSNNGAGNLEWVSHKENTAHAIGVLGHKSWREKGTFVPKAGKTLTREDVIAIRSDLNTGASMQQIGARYGVSASTVLHIKQRRTWGHVE